MEVVSTYQHQVNSTTKVGMFLWEMCQLVDSFIYFHKEKNPWLSTCNHMMLTAKWPGFPWLEDKAGICIALYPFARAFIQTWDPGCREDISHILVPSIDHLPCLPKIIFSRRKIFICVGKWLKECTKSFSTHKVKGSERRPSKHSIHCR